MLKRQLDLLILEPGGPGWDSGSHHWVEVFEAPGPCGILQGMSRETVQGWEPQPRGAITERR